MNTKQLSMTAEYTMRIGFLDIQLSGIGRSLSARREVGPQIDVAPGTRLRAEADRLHFSRMNTVHVPLQSRRLQRAQILQKLNHAIPAVGLLAAGAQALAEGARGWDLALAVVEIATTLMLALTLVRTLRAMRETSHGHDSHGVDWIDIWAAAVLFAEAWERWHLKHHIPRPMIVTALTTLGLGLFHGRLASIGRRRRALIVSDEGVFVGGRPFQRFRARWADITAISIAPRTAEISTRMGRVRRIDFADLQNADAVRAALEDARRQLTALRDPEASPTEIGLPVH